MGNISEEYKIQYECSMMVLRVILVNMHIILAGYVLYYHKFIDKYRFKEEVHSI